MRRRHVIAVFVVVVLALGAAARPQPGERFDVVLSNGTVYVHIIRVRTVA